MTKNLLKNSPYSNFDPEEDPYLQRYAETDDLEYGWDRSIIPDLIRHLNISARNLAAMTVGFPGDIQSILHEDIEKLRQEGRDLPDSDDLVESFGGDRDHPSYWPAALLAPGPGEVKSGYLALKALAAEVAEQLPQLAAILLHGSPHKFDKFDLSKIGTGEGWQAYGHGLYFAENPGVAKSYRNQLSETRPHFNVTMPDGKQMTVATGQMAHQATGGQMSDPNLSKMAESLWIQLAVKHGFDDDVAMKASSEIADALGSKESVKAVKASLSDDGKKAFDLLDVEFKQGGHLYEVDIPDETIEKMLDWDAPLSEQPKALQDAIANNPEAAKRIRMATSSFGELNGEQIYEVFAQLPSGGMSRDQRAASAMLSEAGIPGIRYYDGNSRSFPKRAQLTYKGEPYGEPIDLHTSQVDDFVKEYEAKGFGVEVSDRTRNIVVFNPEDIKSVKRDGELVFTKPTTSGGSKLQDMIDIVDKY